MEANELIIDSFAGGGGASLGIAWATGRAPNVAINHDASALKMHEANHPSTIHLHEDIWKANPRKVTKGKKVGLLWASPDCRHFSRAKGGKPVSKQVRSLAWVVIKWAVEAKPRIIILENVREFEDWGPIVPMHACQKCDWTGTEGQIKIAAKRRRCPQCGSLCLKETDRLMPDPKKKGLTFKQWVGRLRHLGYHVEWRNLDAADFGAPTHRKRLFLIARRDGEPIVWPSPTHCHPTKIEKGGLFLDDRRPYRTAAECIDWSIPCPSIFDRKKPLAEKTLRRIALGMKRYVLDNPKPFIVPITHGGGDRTRSIEEPLPTITTAHRGELMLATPYIAQLAHGEGKHGRWGSGSNSAEQPLGTIHSGGNNHALVEAMLSPYLVGAGGSGYAGKPREADRPLGTIIKENHTAVAAPVLVKFRGESNGLPVGEPMPTVTSGAGAARPAGAAHAMGMVYAFLKSYMPGGENEFGASVSEPDQSSGTANPGRRDDLEDCEGHVKRKDRTCEAPEGGGRGQQFYGHSKEAGRVPDDRIQSLQFGYLAKYYGTAVGQPADCPLGTTTSKPRFAIVQVQVSADKTEPAVVVQVPGVGPCIIADIGLRMLTPRELARAQGFPDTYQLVGSKSTQVAKVGNSVCPVMAKVLVEANYCRVAAGV